MFACAWQKRDLEACTHAPRRFSGCAFLLAYRGRGMNEATPSGVSSAGEPGAVSSAPGRRTRLSGWGRYPVYESEVYRPEKLAELRSIVVSNTRTLIARGAGRAYGDAAVNAGARVVDVGRMNRMLAFDAETRVLRCEAGVTIGEMLDLFVPRGFFPPVTPGTRYVTLGGAIAADVHGKNHHRDSSLAAHVLWFDLMLASGEIKRCSREENTDLFWATVGGMGLTGVIIELAIRLRRITSAYLEGEIIRAADLDDAIARFEAADSRYDYSVAWIDCLARRGALGRSILSVGNFAAPEALPARLRQAPLRPEPPSHLTVPLDLPGFVLAPASVRAFNAVYYLRHPSAAPVITPYQPFFYPLDSIENWNRIYGRRGFVQYQCVWPVGESREGLVEVLEAIANSGRGSFLAVLKKFGAQEGMLSFPMPGYTLALDFPLTPGLLELLDRLDAMVIKRGGRVYLAKDARLAPETLRAMYPNLDRWRQVKALADPDNRFSSSLSRRLKMEPA